VKLEPTTTVREAMKLLAPKVNINVDDLDDYQLLHRRKNTLAETKTIMDKDTPLFAFKMHKNRVCID
jgi:hypothetical protein